MLIGCITCLQFSARTQDPVTHIEGYPSIFCEILNCTSQFGLNFVAFGRTDYDFRIFDNNL